MDMAVDIMFDRGFALRVEDRQLTNGVVSGDGAQEHMYLFKITFQPPQLHNKGAGKISESK